MKKKNSVPIGLTLWDEAKSEDEFDKAALDSEVKETSQQIGAKIKKWGEG